METCALRREQARKEEMARREKSVLASEAVWLGRQAALLVSLGARGATEGPNNKPRVFYLVPL